jgi:Fe2+ or Zn2+ uptake regulation protein
MLAGVVATPETSEDLLERAVDLLRASGRRMTAARRLLLRFLFDGGSHRTAEELTADMKTVFPEVSLSTIYRNLDELERMGIVGHIDLGQGAATYFLATERHGHVVCEQCGVIFEIPLAAFQEIEKFASKHYGVTVSPHQCAVLGTCVMCAAQG